MWVNGWWVEGAVSRRESGGRVWWASGRCRGGRGSTGAGRRVGAVVEGEGTVVIVRTGGATRWKRTGEEETRAWSQSTAK